jgi:glycosyltransferase involved in cell wall biosynthesis
MTEPPGIRVLYCIESMLHGGTEKQLAALIQTLDRQRVVPALCTLKPSTMDLAPLRCPVIELDFVSFRSPSAVRSMHRLRRFITRHQINVVQTFFQDPTILGVLASIATGVQVRIVTFRDLGFWRTPMKVAQLRLVYPLVHGFIANARAVAERVHQLDAIPLDKIEIIPNGVEVPDLPASRLDAAPVVGIVANLDRPVKRVDLFLESARLVADALPEATFVVIGDGHLRAGLEALAQRLGIAQRVRFLGSVKAVGPEVAKFDVGVLSSDSEGLSNSILEYMASGVPTVARDVGGNAELIANGETGIIVSDDTPQALSAAIIGVLRDSVLRRRLGARAREVVRESYSIAACARRYERYYTSLLPPHDPARIR